MKHSINVEAWFEELESSNIDTPQIIIGYGSLLSRYSRDKYSNIKTEPLPLLVNDWERAWITRSIDEKQTYVGVIESKNSFLNAQAFHTCIDQSLLKREKDYRFTELATSSLAFHSEVDEHKLRMLSGCRIYICETLGKNLPTTSFPVNSSYIHTCLKGCSEVGGEEEVERFINTTKHWPHEVRYHDTKEHRYPRAALLDKEEISIFSEIEKSAFKI